jgi:type I restriction enzyme, S subunit
MSDNTEYELGDIFPVSISGEWGSDPFGEGNAMVIRAADFTKDCKLRTSVGASRNIPQFKLGNRILKDGDILIEKSGGSPDQPVGRVAFFDRGIEDQVYIHSNFLQLLRVADGFDKKFSYYLMAFLYSTGLVFRYQQQTTGIINLKLENYLKEKVSVPYLSAQSRIQKILSTIDQAIEKTEALIEKYQHIKAGLMHDLFTRGIAADGKLRPPKEQSPELYQETPIGWIPKEWEIVSLGEISDIVRGSTPRPAKDPKYFDGDFIPWITVGELSREDWPYLNDTRTMLTELGSSFSRILNNGTLVISNSGYGCGVPKILNITGCANDGVAAFLNLNTICDKLFLYYKLYSQIITLRTKVARGNDQPNLNTDMLGEFTIALPSLKEQQKAAERFWSVDFKIKNEKTLLEKIKLQKSGLMHDLLTGKVEVSIDNTEVLVRA